MPSPRPARVPSPRPARVPSPRPARVDGPPREITLTARRPLRDLYACRSRNLSTHAHMLS